MPDPSPVHVDSTRIAPLPVPRSATHFKLRKGGPKGTDCFHTDDRGVSIVYIPIEDFDKDTITRRWSFDDWFVVNFFKADAADPSKMQAIGTWKRFGIVSETAEPEEVTSLVPMPQPSAQNAISDSLAALGLLKDIASKDVEVQVAASRAYGDAMIESSRQASTANLQIMTNFMTAVMSMNRPPPPAVDPLMAQTLAQLAETNRQILAELRGEEEEEEEEEESDTEAAARRYADLVRDVRKTGIGAIWEYAKDEGVMALVRALPTLEQKLPDVMKMLQPILEQGMRSMMGQAQPSAPPAPQYVPPPAPAFNGAADAETPDVS
jgi:hypothetical protein